MLYSVGWLAQWTIWCPKKWPLNIDVRVCSGKHLGMPDPESNGSTVCLQFWSLIFSLLLANFCYVLVDEFLQFLASCMLNLSVGRIFGTLRGDGELAGGQGSVRSRKQFSPGIIVLRKFYICYIAFIIYLMLLPLSMDRLLVERLFAWKNSCFSVLKRCLVESCCSLWSTQSSVYFSLFYCSRVWLFSTVLQLFCCNFFVLKLFLLSSKLRQDEVGPW